MKKALQSERRARDDRSADLEIELERLVNELAADQAALRIVTQSFLLRVFALRPETAPAALAELQNHVLRSVEAIPLATDDEVGAARWKKLVFASAERLLGEISDTFAAGDPPATGRAVRRKGVSI